jgi:phosphate starvation-inducible membrane PsiE
MLLGRCKDHFDQENKLNAKIDVLVSFFITLEFLTMICLIYADHNSNK